MTPRILVHWMKVDYMLTIAILEPSIALLTIVLFNHALGFNHWSVLMQFFALCPHHQICTMLKSRKIKQPNLLNISNTSNNRFMMSYKNPMSSTRNNMTYIKFHTSLRLVIKWLHLQKQHFIGHYKKLQPLQNMPYAITKYLDENDFDLSIPTFIGLHLVFNIVLLQPYLPLILDTSKEVVQLDHK